MKFLPVTFVLSAGTLMVCAVLMSFPQPASAVCAHPAQTAAAPRMFPCDGSGGASIDGVEFGGIPEEIDVAGPTCEEVGLTQPDQAARYAGAGIEAAVAQAVAELTAEGADLTGDNCGQIVERAILYIPGAGLLEKTTGANYNGHSIDYIVFEDGYSYDVVGSCGTQNNPAYLLGCCFPPGGVPPFLDPTVGLCTSRRI